MGRPKKNENREATHLRILKASEEIFGRSGYRNSRLEDIAEEAGIRRSSLLYHFGSKDALYDKVVDRAFEEVQAAFLKALALDGSFEERLECVVLGLQESAEQRKGSIAIILRELVSPNPKNGAQMIERLEPLITGIETFIAGELGASKNGAPSYRSVILHLVIFHLARAAGSAEVTTFLGDPADTLKMARALLS